MSQYFDHHSIIVFIAWYFYFIYIHTRRIDVLMFLEIAVSRVPISVSPYLSRRIGAS
jgi:hypothetical protein